jgi:UDP-N-acetylglucosamine--N-acetylmuramyl-(pentapeptide) pyrophosphoryl-undecaprenol N-acetylglucosamine transferase
MGSHSPRLLIAASGTGGHVFPAVAVAEHLHHSQPPWQIEWLGVPDRMEGQLIPDRYPLHTISMSGLQGGSKLHAGLRLGKQLATGIPQVKTLLQQGQFDGVFTTGGYIAAPAILAARWARIPVLLHESNAIPGKVTQLLARWCQQVALGDPAAHSYLLKTVDPARLSLVGTPVRPEFEQPDILAPDTQAVEALGIPAQDPVIGVIGGSQGGRGLNRIVIDCAPAWLEAGAWILHITGQGEFETVQALAPHHPRYLRFPFWQAMAALLNRVDFVVSRAGSGTLAELAATGTPAILIPYPYAAEDHQFVNGLGYVRQGAAVMLREEEGVAQAVQRVGLEWLQDPALLAEKKHLMSQMARPQAAARVAELLRHLVTDR